jgi:hypothetical protein
MTPIHRQKYSQIFEIMPPLPNPRYERFAQAIVAGLAGETRIERAQSTAYRVAYPTCSEGNSAEAAASRLLRRVKPIVERVAVVGHDNSVVVFLLVQASHDDGATPPLPEGIFEGVGQQFVDEQADRHSDID